MNAYIKQCIRMAVCLLLLLVGQAVVFSSMALAKKDLIVNFDGNSDGFVRVKASWHNQQGDHSVDDTISSTEPIALVTTLQSPLPQPLGLPANLVTGRGIRMGQITL